MNIDYADAILKLRAYLNISQEEFAKLLGVSFTSINRWEAIRHEPIIKIKRKIVDLCKENNISLED